MKGIIVKIKENEYGQEFGFILANNISYYFDSRNLTEGTMADLYVDDPVEFEPQTHPLDPAKKKATNVRLDSERMNVSLSSNSNQTDDVLNNPPEGESLQQKTGYITSYYNEKGFGFVDGKLFFHISSVLNSEDFVLDTQKKPYKVLFSETENRRKMGELCAVQITILEEADKKSPYIINNATAKNDERISVAPVPFRHKGYIILYMQQKKCGYIVSESEYGKATRGDIYFELGDLNEAVSLNTFSNHYYVSYTLEGKTSQHAKNICILDIISLPKACPKVPVEEKEKIFQFLSEVYKDGDVVSLADLGNYLHTKDISYKKYGYDKLRQFCMDLSEYMVISDKIVGNGTQSFATIQMSHSTNNPGTNCSNALDNTALIEHPYDELYEKITEDIKQSIYVFLLNKFKVGMQWPIAAVIRELSYAGYGRKKYGFHDRKEFLRQFSEFITIEDIVQNGIPDTLVSLNYVSKWESDPTDGDSPIHYFENKKTPGINQYARLDRVSKNAEVIIEAFSEIFYVTTANHISVGAKSEYDYCLLKPTALISEQFNLNREIVFVFSNYETFEPRSLDAVSRINEIISTKSPLRLDRICSVMISNDSLVAEKLKDILKTNSEEMQMVIPFSCQEIFEKRKSASPADWREFVVQRFRDYFYERDLFSFRAPLKKDLYFFGRQNFVQELVNRHFSHENSGVFGLRRSGKTSILYAIQRSLDRAGNRWLWVDCQSISTKRWYDALHYLVLSAYERFGIEYNTNQKYTYENAPELFERDMYELSKAIDWKSLLVMFDEIEQITFDIALAEHWRQGADFICFWRAIRAYYQKYPEFISFIVAGTNPKAIETARINGYDNPLYQQLSTETYLPSFNVSETTDMVNKLGGYMGLKFDEIVCTLLTQDFGGQPFIIRQVCSEINRYVNSRKFVKPRTISKNIYDEVQKTFKQSETLNSYCELILEVLQENYPAEYSALEYLAIYDEIPEDLLSKKTILAHLIGYGIIKQDGDLYGFSNDTLKDFILDKNRYCKKLSTDEEKWREISERRNRSEKDLRGIVRRQLRASLGENIAKDKVLDALKRIKRFKAQYENLPYKDLFSPQKCEVYWSEMVNLVYYNWEECFYNIFSNKTLFKAHGEIINNLRRDCHAYEVSDVEMDSFRVSISWFEEEIDNAQ